MQMAQTFEDFVNQIELIKSSEARLYQFLEQMPVGVFIIDREYNIIFSNQRSNEILGWSYIQNIDFRQIKNYLDLYNTTNDNSTYTFEDLPIIRSLKGEKVISEDMSIVNPRGENIRLRILTTPITLSGNKIDFALAIFDTIPFSNNHLLSELLNFNFSKNNYSQFNEFATNLLCKHLNVTRVGIWINQTSYIECLNIFDSEKKEHQKGLQIFKKEFPIYFNYISRGVVLPVENAMQHEATREFKEIYFEPLQIKSTLDCPIFIHDQLYAIICCEVSYRPRKWKDSEIDLIQSYAKLLSLLIEKYYFNS